MKTITNGFGRRPMLVSFYTPDYTEHAVNLKHQCDVLGVPNLIVPKTYGSTWIDNVRAKPTFLLEMSQQLKRDFFWLDVDCQILKPLPELTEWGVLTRDDGSPHDFVHFVPYNSEPFLKQWASSIIYGSHTAFIELNPKTVTIPDGHFKLGLSKNESKTKFLQQTVSRVARKPH